MPVAAICAYRRTMDIDPRTPTVKNPPERFTGDVWLDPIAAPRTEGQRMIVAKVRFAPGARVELHAGQTAYSPPGEEHWHGAAADSLMEHLAMLDNADDPDATTTWLEHVTDEVYGVADSAVS